MARTRVLVNDDTSDWVISQFGGLVVLASGTLDISGLLSDAEIGNAINDNGLILSGVHKLRVNTRTGTTDLTDSASFEMATQTLVDSYAGSVQKIKYAEDEGIDSTTSTDWGHAGNPKVSKTFTAEAGDYMVEWSCEIGGSTLSTEIEVRVQLDNTTDLAEVKIIPNIVVAQQGAVPVSGFKKITLTAASHTIDLDYRKGLGGTVYIRYARLKIFKVESS